MLANSGRSVKWDVKFSMSYGREVVVASGVDGNFAVMFVNTDGRWQTEFWNGGFAGTLCYASLADAAKDAERWSCGDDEFHPLFFEPPAWWSDEEDGQPEDGRYQLNLIDEVEEAMAKIEPLIRAEEAAERAAAMGRAA